LILEAQIPRVFQPLLDDSARYLGAWGGRGSGKSHFFAWRLLKKAITRPGFRAVCIREVQKTLKDSSKRLIEDKLNEHGLGSDQGFSVLADHIKTPGDGVITFMGMQDSNSENIKSLEGFDVAWVEEAQTLSSRSLSLLRPTIRKDGSQLWFSWNARRKTDAVDVLLRGDTVPTGTRAVLANWRDNPFFPAVLEQERLDCIRIDPDQYGHIWEGEYASILVGAYYAKAITEARNAGRIGRLAAEPLLPLKAAWDIGGTGARADAVSIWIFQNVGKEIRVLDYYEAIGQPLATHIMWMLANGYRKETTRIYLPHDGTTQDKVFDVSYQSSLQLAGYDVTVIPNQGKGAAAARIETTRRLFGSCWFDAEKCAAGIDALGWYHEKKDEVRNIGLGPEHDWSSHGADAFGLACIVSEQEITSSAWGSDIDYSRMDKVARCV
jgi:phage terminase large subunit